MILIDKLDSEIKELEANLAAKKTFLNNKILQKLDFVDSKELFQFAILNIDSIILLSMITKETSELKINQDGEFSHFDMEHKKLIDSEVIEKSLSYEEILSTLAFDDDYWNSYTLCELYGDIDLKFKEFKTTWRASELTHTNVRSNDEHENHFHINLAYWKFHRKFVRMMKGFFEIDHFHALYLKLFILTLIEGNEENLLEEYFGDNPVSENILSLKVAGTVEKSIENVGATLFSDDLMSQAIIMANMKFKLEELIRRDKCT